MKRQTGRRRHLNVVRKETWMRVKDPDALRRRRLNCNYTQRQLAFLVNKSQNAISKLETGQMKTLSEGFAIALAARLDRDWEELFVLEEQEVMPEVTHGACTTERNAA